MEIFKKWWVPAVALLCATCGQPSPSPAALPESTTFQNVIVLLDLSDRIEQQGQLAKDQEIIKAVLDVFQDNQKPFGFINSRDRLRLAIAPEPAVRAVANNNFFIDMSTMLKGKKTDLKGKPAFDQMRENFEAELVQLYEEAAKSPNTGADIYSFFCTDLPVSFMTDANEQTKVIVLTDGYLYFNRKFKKKRPDNTYMKPEKIDKQRKAKDWKAIYKKDKLALLPCSRALNGVEVLILELAPDLKGASVNEFDLVSHYWTDWFDKMKVNAFPYPQNDQIGNIKGYIKNFLKRQ